jgi:hypothetical protein
MLSLFLLIGGVLTVETAAETTNRVLARLRCPESALPELEERFGDVWRVVKETSRNGTVRSRNFAVVDVVTTEAELIAPSPSPCTVLEQLLNDVDALVAAQAGARGKVKWNATRSTEVVGATADPYFEE